MVDSFIFLILILLIAIVAIVLFTFFLIKRNIKRNIEISNERTQLLNRFENKLLKSKNELSEELLKRISLEIHDNISQLLTLIKWNLSALDNSNNVNIKESKLYIIEAISALRALSQTINGDFVLKEGLNAAVLKLSNSFNSLKHLACYFENTTGSDILLSDDIELILYRCIQEIVNNSVKHSEADEIRIIFSQSGSFFKVLIIDNGKGFDTSNTKNNGIGLKSISERISLIDGEIKINSIINKGTHCTLSVPINQ